jgi:hypothetical protein
MAYIGNTPEIGFNTLVYQKFNGTGACTQFTIAQPISDPNYLEILVNNVQQEPYAAYNVASGVITFSEAPSAGANNVQVGMKSSTIIYYSTINGSQIIDSTITGTKLQDSSITSDKIADGAIQGNDIAVNAISANQITVGAITGNLLSTNIINSNNIVDGAILGNDIAVNAISANNFSPATNNKIFSSGVVGSLIFGS